MTRETTKPKTLAEALIEFKKQDIAIFKQSTNSYFKKANGEGSKYADLATILEAVEVPLAELGIIISSHSHLIGEQWVETTTLEFGAEKKESSFPLFGNDPQKMGSSITYARRFNIQSLLNLAALDDDGNEAAKGEKLESKKTYDANAAFKDLLENVVQKAVTLDALGSNWKVRGSDIARLEKENLELFNKLVEYKDDRKAKFQAAQPAAE